MDYTTLDNQGLISAIQQAGRSPDPQLLTAILENKAKSKPILLNMFRQHLTDKLENLNEKGVNDPQRQTGIIVGRLLIEMQATEAIPMIGEHLRQVWGDDVTADGLDRDPAHFGPMAIPVFEALVQMNTLGKWHNGKAIAVTILTDIALLHPETAAQIKASLRTSLPPLNAKGGISAPTDEMWGDIAIALGKLQDQESHKQIIAMIRQGVIDSAVVSRERYENFVTGKKKPKQPEPFDIFKKYESHLAFEQLLAGVINSPVPEPPDHAQDLVTKAKQAEARKLMAKSKAGRNDPCACGSGKKYKNCCG